MPHLLSEIPIAAIAHTVLESICIHIVHVVHVIQTVTTEATRLDPSILAKIQGVAHYAKFNNERRIVIGCW